MKVIDILNEVSYNKFKTSIKHRTQSEQLHKAVKDVKIKLKEIDRIIEHTAKLKQELCEDDDNLHYWKHTNKNILHLKEMTQNIYKKIHSLIK